MPIHSFSVPLEDEKRKLQGMKLREELKKMVKCTPVNSQMMLGHYALWWVLKRYIQLIEHYDLCFNSYCKRSPVKGYAVDEGMCQN